VIHHDSMSTHKPNGSTLVIHSVSVVPEMRRKKLGTDMLKRYMDNIVNNKDYTNISLVLLLTHEYLVPFYSNVSG
jgi:guanine nucleotide exchange factor